MNTMRFSKTVNDDQCFENSIRVNEWQTFRSATGTKPISMYHNFNVKGFVYRDLFSYLIRQQFSLQKLYLNHAAVLFKRNIFCEFTLIDRNNFWTVRVLESSYKGYLNEE